MTASVPEDPMSVPGHYRLAVDQAHAYLNRPSHAYSEETLKWMVNGLMVLAPTELDILALWLEGNEGRIAGCVDGLGMLAPVFERVIGRAPSA